mgnify:CR=1 FL=1
MTWHKNEISKNNYGKDVIIYSDLSNAENVFSEKMKKHKKRKKEKTNSILRLMM